MGGALGLLSVVILVAANGFFVAAEFAIVAVRRSRLEEEARLGSIAAQAAQDVVQHLDAYLATCQVGITVASLALGWVGEPALAHFVEPPLEAIAGHVAPTFSHGIAFAISFGLITTMHIVLGEQAAKGLALQKTYAAALFVAPPLRVIYKVLRWPIVGLNVLCNAVLGLLGMHSAWGEDKPSSVEELRLLLSSSREAGLVEAWDARIASKAFAFSNLAAGSLLTPRTELDAVPLDIERADLVKQAQTCGHTRLIVYAGSLDDIVGVVHVRDVLAALDQPESAFQLTALLRPILTVPKGKRADALLDEMRSTRCHVAVVIEESGGTAGIITLRDIIGGLVGRIESELPPDTPAAERRDASGAMLLDGLTRIEEFEELTGIDAGRAVPAKVETLGGLIMALTGRIPAIGDFVQVEGRTLEVTERDGMRVSRIRLHPAPVIVTPVDEVAVTG